MVNKPVLRYVLSPLLVLLFLIGVDFASRYEWFTVSLALPIGVLSLCLFWSGLRANILSAVFITAYALYNSSFDPSRTIQLVFAVWPVAVTGGLLKRWLIESVIEAERNRHAAEAMSAVNGNLGKLKEIHLDSVKLVDAWKSLNDTAKFEVVNNIRGNLAHVLNIWEGWHALFQEREAVKWENLRQKQRGRDD